MAASSNKVVDIPPIIVLDVSSVFNFKGFLSSCSSKIIDYEVTRLDEGRVKVTCFTKEDHSLILSNLYGSGYRAHSIMRHLNDYRRFIIRGLHHSIPISSIRAEFEFLNFTLCHIRNLKFYRSHEPMNLFEIAVAPFELERVDEFLAIKKLCNRPVTIERQRQSEEPTMCQRCQRYGHTKNYCRRDPVCVICAGPLHKAVCPLPWSSPPKCANCGGKHVATYKGCVKFMEAKESLSLGPTNSSAQRHLSTSQSQQCISPPMTSHRALNLFKPLPSPTKRDPQHSKPPRRAPSPARDDLSNSSGDSCTTNRPSRPRTTSSRRVLSPSRRHRPSLIPQRSQSPPTTSRRARQLKPSTQLNSKAPRVSFLLTHGDHSRSSSDSGPSYLNSQPPKTSSNRKHSLLRRRHHSASSRRSGLPVQGYSSDSSYDCGPPMRRSPPEKPHCAPEQRESRYRMPSPIALERPGMPSQWLSSSDQPGHSCSPGSDLDSLCGEPPMEGSPPEDLLNAVLRSCRTVDGLSKKLDSITKLVEFFTSDRLFITFY